MTKHLLVASTGGHLEQLHRIAMMRGIENTAVWTTFDTPQSRSLLAGSRVHYVPYIRPRDLVGVGRAIPRFHRILHEEQPDAVISTGSAIALAALPTARLRRIPAAYIESLSRVQGPSLTGRILAALHTADLYTQYPSWADRRWREHDNILASYRVVGRTGPADPARPRLFVTLGTIAPYRFDRLVDAVLATGLASASTVWQLGATVRDGLPGRVFTETSRAEFLAEAADADVVITHSGIGSLLGLIELGIRPVVVPRSRRFGEHVDDHQHQIAALAATIGIATAVAPEAITADVLRTAAYTGVESAL